jgi:acetoin utilization protein AcuB
MATLRNIGRYMTPLPATIHPKAYVLEAMEQMRFHRIRHLPVEDETGVIGIISDRDIKLAGALLPDEDDLFVEDVMTSPPYLVQVDTSLTEVVSEMEAKKLGSAIITDSEKKKTLGIFTAIDALRTLKAELLSKNKERAA